MDDETLMQHFESEHSKDLLMEFRIRPDRTQRELAASSAWNTYHDTLHRLWPEAYEHNHDDEKGESMTPPPSEKIFITMQEKPGGFFPHAAYMTRPVAEANHPDAGSEEVEEVTLHRPDLRPIYGGPTLLEALWEEMDTIMERLMTGQISGEDICTQKGFHGVDLGNPSDSCGHEDNGDKYRAQQLAWVLAIVTNPYEPSVDAIRAETMNRWNAAQAAADQDDLATRPEGADQ